MREFSWSNVKQHSSYHRSNTVKRLPVRRDFWNWVFSSHGVCSTAFLKSTKGTAAKDIGRCKAKSRKEVLWSPLDFDVQLVNCQCAKERRKAEQSSIVSPKIIYYLWFHGVFSVWTAPASSAWIHHVVVTATQTVKAGGRLGNWTGWRRAGRVFGKSLYALWMQRCFLLLQQVPSYVY